MIELKNVSKYYHQNDVTNLGLANINLKFNQGEFVAITGESGSGKSTLLNVIAKIDSFDEGEIIYNDTETSIFTLDEMDSFRKNKVGFIFQNYNIIDSYTVLENVMLPLIIKGKSKEEAEKKANELIEKVGLVKFKLQRGTQLSGGQKQRCVIARALASDCDILACDEPTGNLDSATSKEIINLLKEVGKDKLVLMVTHNYDEVKDIVTRKIVMKDGKVISDDEINSYDVLPDGEDYENFELSRKTAFRLANKMTFSTPLRSFFCLFILTVVSFLFLIITQGINFITNEGNDYYVYHNHFDDHLVVYNNDYSKLDVNKLEDFDVFLNPFCEETSSDGYINGSYYYLYYYDRIPKAKLVEGNPPLKDDECALYINRDYYYYYHDRLGSEICLNYIPGNHTGVKISGIYTFVDDNNTDWSNPYYVSGNEKLRKIFNSLSLDIDVIYNNHIINNLYYYPENGSSKIVIKVPTSLYEEDATYKVRFNSLYELNNYEVVKDDSVYDIQICIYGDFDINNEVFIANVYSKNLNKTARQLNRLGFDVTKPRKVTNTGLDQLITHILGAFLSIYSAIFLVVVFFIVYLFLSKLMSSRVNDYEIFRTLGVTKKEMRKVVRFEITILGMISSVISLIIFDMCRAFAVGFSVLPKLSLFSFVFYFGIMYLFSFLIANKFNRSLYKLTVRKSLGSTGVK